MSGGGGGQAQGDDKNSMAILWVIAGVFIVGAIIWWSFGIQLKYFFIKLRILELTIAYWIFKVLPFDNLFNSIQDTLLFTKSLNTANITLSAAKSISITVGKIYRWPVSVFFMVATYVLYIKNIKIKYKKHYDMKLLAQQERTEWPQINSSIDVDLVEEDVEKGPWAMAMQPIEFCKKNKLIDVKILPQDFDVVNKAPKFKAILNRTKADLVFSNQLGRIWYGPEKIPLYRRALLAAFIARGMRDTKAAQNLIIQINRSVTNDLTKELDFTGVDELWKKHYNSKLVQSIVQSHAYEFTLFIGLFLFAREDGVFPTSDFLWLKPRDRLFWYVLNGVGRQTYCTEAAGVFAHFLTEKALGRPLSVPMVTEATNALQHALDEMIYKPDDEERERLLQAANEAGI